MQPEDSLKPPAEPPVVVELRSLTDRAKAGDVSALPHLRRVLDEHPEIWRHLGDLTAGVERAWLAVASVDNAAVMESVKRSLAELKAELAGDHPTRLERIMVDETAACWLELQYLRTVSASTHGSLPQANFLLKRLESAQKRFDRAVKNLTTIRVLMPRSLAPSQAIKLHQFKREVG